MFLVPEIIGCLGLIYPIMFFGKHVKAIKASVKIFDLIFFVG
jgi:hypothetical protein